MHKLLLIGFVTASLSADITMEQIEKSVVDWSVKVTPKIEKFKRDMVSQSKELSEQYICWSNNGYRPSMLSKSILVLVKVPQCALTEHTYTDISVRVYERCK